MNKEFNSNTLYIMKAFATISIVFSHSNVANIENIYLRNCLSICKPIGVYIFLIISGYFFNYKKYSNIKMLLLDKYKKICIPWLFCGILTYISNFLLKPFYFDMSEIINWILGNGTYLYYLTNLMLIYIIIYLITKNLKIYYCFIILNILSIFLTQINLFPTLVDTEQLAFTYLNPYLNLFNWIGIFSLGICLKQYDLFKIKINKKLVLILFIIIALIITIFQIESTYWHIITPLLGIISFFILFEVSKKVSHSKILINIGKKSFSIYLLHLPVIAFFCRIFPPEISFITSILVVVLMLTILTVGEKISEKLCIKNIYSILCGIR